MGDNCANRQKGFANQKILVEMTTEEIKRARIEHKDNIVQPFREGVFSKEYYDRHGTSGVKVSDQDLKNMKNVWTEDSYYKP